MYSNLEFFNKLKEYAKSILGLKNVTVGELRTFIPSETCSADWNKSINAKIGLDETCDESEIPVQELVDENGPIKGISTEGIVNKRFHGSYTITIVNMS